MWYGREDARGAVTRAGRPLSLGIALLVETGGPGAAVVDFGPE
jgi:hypothetical protein